MLKMRLSAVFISALLPLSLHASTASYVTINDPADNSLQTPTFNQLLGINNAGVISGYFGDGVLVNNNGFVYSNGTFTPENVSGADQTQVVAINNTKSGGTYQTAGFWATNATGANHGFTNVGGTVTTINGPGSTFTQVLGLNDKGQTVGFYQAGGVTNGFLSNLSGSTLSTLTAPTSWNATAVTAAGINNAGTIVGFYTNTSGTAGFIDNNGVFSSPTDPLGTNTMFTGINNLGQIVGTDTSNATGAPEGLIYNIAANTWTSFMDPNENTVAGSFGVSGTTFNGINDEGQVVGFYEDSKGDVDGLLVYTTPEPASIGLVGLAGALSLVGCIRRRRSS